MSADPDPEPPAKGDEYALPNGVTEIVFAVEEGHVLTVREYESVDAFEEGVSGGRYTGMREDVASLPDAEEFAEPGSTPDGDDE